MERAAPDGKERASDSPPCCASTTDFTRPRLDAAVYPVPAVTGTVCPANPALIASRAAPRWERLHDVARRSGWGV